MECSSWISIPGDATWPVALRATLYSLGLLYCFLGLGTITQKYMDAMETIVGQTRTTKTRDKKTGQVVIEKVKVWNPTIADITLLALGTSAPAISLALIASISELGNTSSGPDVGTGTMFGGAAFNFFCILACCILIPKRGSLKRVANFGVFLVELLWSIWAYIWLFLVLKLWTPDEVTLLEASLTILHMPILMVHAYAQDRHWPVVSFPRSWTQFDLTDHTQDGQNGSAAAKSAELAGQRPTHGDTWQGVSGSEAVGCRMTRPSSAQRLREMVEGLEYVSDDDASWHGTPTPPKKGAKGASGKEGETGVREIDGDEIKVEVVAGSDSQDTDNNRVFRKIESDEDLTVDWDGKSMTDSRFSSVESGLAVFSAQEGSVHTAGSVQLTGSALRLSNIQEAEGEREKYLSVELGASLADAAAGEDPMPAVGLRWRQQIMHALLMKGEGSSGEGQTEGEGCSRQQESRTQQFVSLTWRLLCYLWRVLFAVVLPPPDVLGGWPAFLLAIAIIAFVAAVVIELTHLLGCVVGVDPFVLSITLLAAGTSIPNIMASAIAATHSRTADSAIANINASNCINVFLGLGLPWLISTVYNQVHFDSSFAVSASALGPSLIVYLGTLFVGIIILLVRRWCLGGELGGAWRVALASSGSLLLLWVLFCALSVLIFYGLLK